MMVIDHVRVRLNGTFKSQDSDCTPALDVFAEWHLVREADGQVFMRQLTYCSGPTNHPSFVALFADEAQLAAAIASALKRLGREVALELRAARGDPCKL